MKVAVITPYYNRIELTTRFLNHLDYLRENLVGIELIPIGIVSDYADKAIVSAHQGLTLFAENDPLSDKANQGFIAAQLFDIDGAIKLDSDDFPSLRWLQLYLTACRRFDFVHVRFLWVYDRPTGRLEGKIFSRVGSCRWLSRQVLEKVQYEPYANGLNKCLDASMDRTMKRKGYDKTHLEPSGGCLITVKSGVNIWPYDEVIMGVRQALSEEGIKKKWKDNYPAPLAEWMLSRS